MLISVLSVGNADRSRKQFYKFTTTRLQSRSFPSFQREAVPVFLGRLHRPEDGSDVGWETALEVLESAKSYRQQEIELPEFWYICLFASVLVYIESARKSIVQLTARMFTIFVWFKLIC